MGLKMAFEELPEPWAVKAITDALSRGSYDNLVGALKAMQGDLGERAEIALHRCWDDLRNDLKAEAAKAANIAENAREKGNSEAANLALDHQQEFLSRIEKIGKGDLVRALEERHPEIHKLFDEQSQYWKIKFWKRSCFDGLDQCRGA